MKYYNDIFNNIDTFIANSIGNYSQKQNSLYPDHRSKHRWLDNQVETAAGLSLEKVLVSSSNTISVDKELKSIDLIKEVGNVRYVCQVKASYNSENSSSSRESAKSLKEFCDQKNSENDGFIYEPRKIAIIGKDGKQKTGKSNGIIKLEGKDICKVFEDIDYDELFKNAKSAIFDVYGKYEDAWVKDV